MLLLVEALFVLMVCAGVAVVYWPAALILGGVLGVWACERESARRTAARSAAQLPRIREAA